jgi:hypothetical protein
MPLLQGVVTQLHRNAEHRFTKSSEATLKLFAGMGVKGDAHFGAIVQHPLRINVDAASEEACSADIERPASSGATAPRRKGQQARRRSSPLSPAPPGRSTWPLASERRVRSSGATTASVSIAGPPTGGSDRSQTGQAGPRPPAHVERRLHHVSPRRWRSAPGGPERRPSRRSPNDDGCDHRRQNFDKHAAYVVVAFGGSPSG